MKTVVLTGGMGSGKSAVSACLRAQGVPVYDSDSRTKSLYDRRPALVDEMEAVLGTGLRDADGRLDRRKLAGLIFSDPRKKAAVEAIILSCPVFDGVGDKVVLVDADEPVRAARAAARDGSDLETALRRIRSQSFDLSRVDLVFRNDGPLETLPARVDLVFPNLFLPL